MWTKEADPWKGTSDIAIERLGLRASNGTAVGHVPSNRDILAVVGAGTAYTEEWLPSLPAGKAAATMDVHLYARTGWNLSRDGLWSPAAVGTPEPAQSIAWDHAPLAFGSAAESGAVLHRIETLNVTLSWNNSLSAAGDLAILVATPNQGQACPLADDSRELGSGTFLQRLSIVDVPGCFGGGPYGDCAIQVPPLDVGAATQGAVVAPLGLAYHIDARATLVESFGWVGLAKKIGDRQLALAWAPTARPVSTSQATSEDVPSGPPSTSHPAPGDTLAVAILVLVGAAWVDWRITRSGRCR